MEVKETNEMDNNQAVGGSNKWILPAIAGALAVSLGFNFYQSSRLDSVNQQVNSVTKKMDALQQGLAAVQTDAATRDSLVKAELAKAKEDVKDEATKAVKTSSWAAQSLAQRHAEKLVNNLAKNEAIEKQKLAENPQAGFSTKWAR